MYKIYRLNPSDIPRPFIHRPFILLAFKILIYGKTYKMGLMKTIDGQNVIMIDFLTFICLFAAASKYTVLVRLMCVIASIH